MAFTITTKCISYTSGTDLPELYIRADSTNPTEIESGETKEIKFLADGTFYTLPAKARVVVSGATKGAWTKNEDASEGTLTISNPTENVVITLKTNARVSSLSAGPFISPNQTPLDARVVLNKSQMPLVADNDQPDHYFAICRDDNSMYYYDKSNTVDTNLGKFRQMEDLFEYKIDGGEIV